MNLPNIVTTTGETILRAWAAGEPYDGKKGPSTRSWDLMEASDTVLEQLPTNEVDVLAEFFSIGRPDPKGDPRAGDCGRRLACAAALRTWAEKELPIDYELARQSADQKFRDEAAARARRRYRALQFAA